MKGKIIVPLILASVSATLMSTQNFAVRADYANDTTLLGDLITVSKFEGKGKVGQTVTLPTVTATNGANLKVTVTDPRGQVVAVSGNSFEPTQKGYYTLKYTAETTGSLQTATEELKILIEGDEYNISLPENSEYVIPATVKTGSDIKIPLPTVKEGKNELKESDLVKENDVNNGLKVYIVNKDNASSQTPLTFNATTKTYDFNVSKAGVYEILYKFYKSGTVQDYKTDSFVVKDNFDVSKMELNFSYSSTKPTTATLGVECKLPEIKVFDKKGTTDALNAHVTITVNHVAADGTKTPYDVKDYAFTPNKKGNYQVTYQASIPLYGKETKTSTFLIEDVKDSVKPSVGPVNQFTTEKVEINGVQKTVVKTVYKDIDKDGVYTAGTDVEVYNRADAKYAEYTEDERNKAVTTALSDTQYQIPSIVALNGTGDEAKATIKVPAVYGVDNFYDLEDITFVRSVRRTSTGIIEEMKKMEDGQRVSYKNNEWAEYTFTSAGDYTIRYIATDKDNNEKMIYYDVKVVASDAELKENGKFIEPEVTFAAVSSSVEANGKLTFSKPTAKDKFDTRVETAVYYSFDKDSYDVKNEIVKVDGNGKLVLNLKEDVTIPTGKNQIYLHAVAKNDYSGTVKSVVRNVAIISTDDSVIPTFETADSKILGNLAVANKTVIDEILKDKEMDPTVIDKEVDTNGQINIGDASNPNNVNVITGTGMIYGSTRAAFNQKDMVKLPSIQIKDNDVYLSVNLTVRDPFGKVVTVKNTKDTVTTDAGSYVHTLSDGSFIADYSGVYTVSYSAKDSGGNIITKSFGIRIFDTEKPTINLSSYDPFNGTVEVGKFIEVPAATLKDNGVLIDDVTTTLPYESRLPNTAGTYWDLIEGPSTNRKGTIGFTPSIAGTYVIKYYGWDKNGNLTQSVSYSITAKDTIKPTITLETDYILNENIDWPGNNVTIVAPGIGSLYDGHRDPEDSNNDFDQTAPSDITLTVKVTDADGNTVANDAFEEDKYTGSTEKTTRYKFVAEHQGVYTITYIATDGSGNSYELTKQVKVGDCIDPEVEWIDSEEDLISTANKGSYYELALNKLKIDGILATEAIEIPSGEDKADYSVVVNLYNPSSSVVNNEYKDRNNNMYKWKFEDSGTYELRITVKDKAGNQTVKSYNIVVSSEKTNNNTVKPIVGTILIIVASLILVGVVAYFVISGRKKANKKGSKNNRKK